MPRVTVNEQQTQDKSEKLAALPTKLPTKKEKPKRKRNSEALREATYQKRIRLAEQFRKSRTAQFWTPAGLERVCRVVIGSITPERDQQTLAALAGVSPGTIGKMKENFRNTEEDAVLRNIQPELVLELAPHVPNSDSPSNPWFLVFMGCGFLDDRDPAELYAGIKLLKKAIANQKIENQRVNFEQKFTEVD